jgi:hypothetical protein
MVVSLALAAVGMAGIVAGMRRKRAVAATA